MLLFRTSARRSADGRRAESPLKALYREVIDAANAVREGLPLIVTGHLHISGGTVSELSERRIIIGGEEAVASDIFPSSVAYVALGHLHKPQSISGQTVIRYAGSPFPMSVAEKVYQHSIVVIDFDKTGGMKTDVVQTPRPIAFYRVPTVGAAPLDIVEDELRVSILTIPASITDRSLRSRSSSMEPSRNFGNGSKLPWRGNRSA